MAFKNNINLPIEILSDILSRLPVKTLLRFRSVQKSWYSLISDPYFIEMHRIQNQKNNYLLVEYQNPFWKTIVVADTFSHERSVFEKPVGYNNCQVVDSYNGLVCIYGQKQGMLSSKECISLWNPALRMNKIICDRIMNSAEKDVKYCVGFGFHEKYNDYKVVRFTPELMYCKINEFVEIYSLRSNFWKNIKIKGAVDFSLRKYTESEHIGVYISDTALIPDFYGAYCWLVQANDLEDGHNKAVIISFDIEVKVFGEIVLPHSLSVLSDGNTYIKNYKPFNYRNSLAVLEILDHDMLMFGPDPTSLYIWMMKEYSDPKSWSKLYKFHHETHPAYDIWFLGITLESELLFRTHYFDHHRRMEIVRLNVLDIKDLQLNASSTKDISILNRPSGAIGVRSFTESLVLLDVKNKRTATSDRESTTI